MNKSDKYFKELLQDIEDNGVWSKKPRTRWDDNTPAQYKSVYDKVYKYDISAGEFPIITTRNTALRGCFEEMRWIYQLQSNIIEDAHSSIHSWWQDFKTDSYTQYLWDGEWGINGLGGGWTDIRFVREIGSTYGYVVRKYDLMNKLLNGLETNPESRRHIINLWDNQSQLEDPYALPPCVYMTKWRVRNQEGFKFVDLSLYQRSRDTLLTASINPAEYVMLQMMVCGHLTWKTGILHKPGILNHYVEDEHVYDRNYWALAELLDREPTGLQPKIELICEPKNFYDYRWEDFKITGLEGIKPLSKKLEIAI